MTAHEAAVAALAEALLPLIKARHETAHVGDIFTGRYDDCSLCEPVRELLAAHDARVKGGDKGP